jgi:hypothetical protein
MVAGLHVGDALTNGLDNASTLVTENNREVALGVLSGERVGIYFARQSCRLRQRRVKGSRLTCVTNASVVNLHAHLVSLGGCNLDILNREALASFPGNGGLAGNGLKVEKDDELVSSLAPSWGISGLWRGKNSTQL